MGLIFAIIIGVVVGAVASSFFRENLDFVLIDSVLGVAGALLGDALYFFLGGNEILLFSWGAVLAEVVMAALVVVVFNLLHTSVPKKEGFETTDSEGDGQ